MSLPAARPTDDGLLVGEATTQGVGFHGTTPSTQRAGAAQAAVVLTAATVATANGSDAATTQTLANALKTELNKVIADNVALAALVNELRAAMVAKGLIKGAA